MRPFSGSLAQPHAALRVSPTGVGPLPVTASRAATLAPTLYVMGAFHVFQQTNGLLEKHSFASIVCYGWAAEAWAWVLEEWTGLRAEGFWRVFCRWKITLDGS